MTRMRSLCLAALLLLLALAGCRSAQTTSAILYMEQEKYDKAVAVLHEALSYNPEEADAFYYLGEAHSKKAEVAITENNFLEAKKNYEMAYEYYNKARQFDPKKFGESVQLALLHNYVLRSKDAMVEYQGHYYEQAEGFFRLAYASLPDSIAPIKNIAVLKIKQASEAGNDTTIMAQALDVIDQVLKVRPDAYSLLANKASVLAKLGRNAQANQIYDALLRDHPQDTALLIDMTNLAVSDGKYERAADLSLKLIDLVQNDGNPDNDEPVKGWMVQTAYWLAMKDIHRYPEAIELYRRAREKELIPEKDTLLQSVLALYNYGSALNDQAALETDPGRKAELEAQARAQFQEGVTVGLLATDTFFECENCYVLLARCQFALGDGDAAEANMKKAMELQAQSGGGQ